MSPVRNVTRLLPITCAVAGRKQTAFFGLLDPLFRSTTRDDAIPTPWGVLTLDDSHEQERLLSYLFNNIERYYDKSELGRYIARVAEPGATFVDIGANLGLYALIARRHGFNTVVVEPEPRHSAFLKRNEQVFGKVLPVALSDQDGELPLYYEATNAGATSLFPAPTYVRGEGVVPVRTFSELATRGEFGDLAKIRLIKIDVEGFEAQVVEGMAEALRTGWRPHIWCEVRSDRSGRNGGSYRVVREKLSEFGYVARELKDGQDLRLDDQELASRPGIHAVFDLLFTPATETSSGTGH